MTRNTRPGLCAELCAGQRAGIPGGHSHMRHRISTFMFAAAFALAACGPSGSSTGPATNPPGATGPAATSSETQAAAFDPQSVSGEVTLGQWESSPAEGTALKAALD